jgi:hypothetical protein
MSTLHPTHRHDVSAPLARHKPLAIRSKPLATRNGAPIWLRRVHWLRVSVLVLNLALLALIILGLRALLRL